MEKLDFKAGIIIVLSVLCIYLYYSKPPSVVYYQNNQGKSITKSDSTTKDSLIAKERIRIVTRTIIQYKQRFDTLRIGDTLREVPVFTARLDTICGDTFSFEYKYPQNEFSVDIRKPPDTLRTLIINNDVTKIIEGNPQSEEEKFYNSLWFRFSTFFVGIIGGLVIK